MNVCTPPQAPLLHLDRHEEQEEMRCHEIRRDNAFQRVLIALATGGVGNNDAVIQQFVDKRREVDSLREEQLRSKEEHDRRIMLWLRDQRKTQCFKLHQSCPGKMNRFI